MGNYGMKISQNGVAVESATLQQTAFSSSYPLFKIAFSGALNVTVPAMPNANQTGQASVTFTHNLGYIPAWRCYSYANAAQTQRQALDMINFNGNVGTDIYIVAEMTSTTLTIRVINWDTVSHSINIAYLIYVDPGT